MLRTVLLIGLGGFIGSVARFLIARFIQIHTGSGFPLGTLGVNLVGCFLIGILYGLTENGRLLSDEVRLFLTVGICGGFTTFSSFAVENLIMAKEGNLLFVLIYAAASLIGCLVSVFLGNLVTKI